MKDNTKKLLTWLYRPQDKDAAQLATTIDYDQLRFLLPDMTPGGRRSLVHYLSQQHLIRAERLSHQTQLSLTSHGEQALAAQFPVFSRARYDWPGQWSALIFLQAPNSDRHFRYLRALLLNHHAFHLRRGVYLHPGEFPPKILNTCQELYVGHVVIVSWQQWQFGDERSLISHHYMLSDLSEVYSGISREINQLLSEKKQQKGLTHKFYRQIFSVFDRLFSILPQDAGLLTHYYPQSPHAAQLLTQLQALATV